MTVIECIQALPVIHKILAPLGAIGWVVIFGIILSGVVKALQKRRAKDD